MTDSRDTLGFFPHCIKLLMCFSIFFYGGLVHAQSSTCATVKIEIQQEATLERQGFEAHMRITNGLTDIRIEDVRIVVTFTDENGEPVTATNDPNDTSAAFFIRLESMLNIDDVSGAGVIEPESIADIYWLIVPSRGASDGVPTGTLYYVGASLSYSVGGEPDTLAVSPDHIYVKPMPELVLDYFLPTDVVGDDAFTPQIEPPEAFSLGVRVQNNGQGTARQFKIDSAQPKITENEQGLLIGFEIMGSKVQGQPVSPTLLVDFGDIDSQSAKVASWRMQCSLSGRFVEFDAEFTHVDELGGALTSLIDSVNTHTLVHEVVADLPGRDGINDFLAKDTGVYRLYESNNVDTDVTDLSIDGQLTYVGLQGSQAVYSLTVPSLPAGFSYTQVTDPNNGLQVLTGVVRSDGKQIRSQNAWLSKTRTGTGPWQYHVNLFDTAGPGTYTLTFSDAQSVPQAPVIQTIAQQSAAELSQVSFIVQAGDPNGTIPMLTVGTLPVGATFIDQGDGSGVFDWTPTVGQAGRYTVTFTASDGALSSSKSAVIVIYSAQDSDGDDLDDAWEMQYFGTLDRDGSGDFDQDGVSDINEYQAGTDPTQANRPPRVPVIEAPVDNGHVASLTPALTIKNVVDPDNDPVTYIFELYKDATLTTLLYRRESLQEGTDFTTWTVPEALAENNAYVWRVRAEDALSRSLWAYGNFFVNVQNEPPTSPAVSYPADNMQVTALSPVFVVTNGKDPDNDPLTYRFEVFSDPAMTDLVVSSDDVPQADNGHTSWSPETALTDNTWYYWRASVSDGLIGQSITQTASFNSNSLSS